MNKTKIILVILGVLVLIGGLIAGLILVKNNQDISEKAAPATTMYITPASQSQAPGSSFTFSVKVDTSSNTITGIDVRINFDPKAIQITSLQKGTGVFNLDQTIVNTFDNTAGSITYAIFTLDSSKAISGSSIEILKVNATVKTSASAGNYNLSFNPATAASATQEGQNVLVSKTPGVLTVTKSESAANATATPTSGTTPTPTPTSAPGASPTATPTPGATSATSTARPTASPAPIPVSGTSWPSIAAGVLGILIIIGALVLAI